MKDLYSFHESGQELEDYYESVKGAYAAVYQRCGLEAILTLASGGLFSKFSHEYQVIAESGEDTIYLNSDSSLARNKEIVSDATDQELLEFCGGEIRTAKSIEVGNIFQLNTRFSEPMGAEITKEDGTRSAVWMGCYGIGVSRLIGTMVEVLSESDSKMVWPKEVAPFKIHLAHL